MTANTGREVLVSAFDRLFEKAANKLQLEYTHEQRDEAKGDILKRFDHLLKLADSVDFPEIPEPAMQQMESAIEKLSPAHVASYVAVGPLAMQVQAVLRQIAMRSMQDRLLADLMNRVDTSYGGN